MDPSHSIPRRGYLFVVAAALLWAVSGSSAKFLFTRGITPFELVQMRLTLATSLLFVWLVLRHRPLLRISMAHLGYFLVLGIAGMAMVQFTYLFTISKIQVAAAILLQYLAPTFVALYAVVIARAKLTILTFTAVLGATLGCYLVVGAYNLNLLALNRTGVVSGIFAGLFFAFYSIYGEKGMHHFNPWTVLFYALLFAALFWNTANLAWKAVPPPLAPLLSPHAPIEWMWILYIAVFGTLIPFGLYFEGINLIRSTRASITATLEPITAGLFSFLFLGETLAVPQILGGILVIASVVLLQVRREFDDQTPALVRLRAQSQPPE